MGLLASLAHARRGDRRAHAGAAAALGRGGDEPRSGHARRVRMGGASYGPTWQSPDPILRKLGVKYLHVGGDWWNRCHGGTWMRDAAAAARDGTGASWLNIDEAFSSEKMGSLTANQIATDDKGEPAPDGVEACDMVAAAAEQRGLAIVEVIVYKP